MNWYKSAVADVSMPQRSPKYHKGQNVIVYSSGGDDSRTGTIIDSQYYVTDDEYAYHVKFEEPNDVFKEDKSFNERDIIPY